MKISKEEYNLYLNDIKYTKGLTEAQAIKKHEVAWKDNYKNDKIKTREKARELFDIVMYYKSLRSYVSRAVDTCMIPAGEMCTPIYRNTFYNFRHNGNVCPKCSAEYNLIVDFDPKTDDQS